MTSSSVAGANLPRSLYQLHVRPRLGEWGRKAGRQATLDDVPDELLDNLASRGYGAVWLLGVWRLSPVSRSLALSDGALVRAFRHYLPDVGDDDILGSPFAIYSWQVDPLLGGEEALRNLKERLNLRGIKLVLDFVANHTARDCPWVSEDPSLYVQAATEYAAEEDFFLLRRPGLPSTAVAYGRDPYFPGWVDTAQLDLRNRPTRDRLIQTVLDLVPLCDGLQLNMAMLGLEKEFQSTWGDRRWAPPRHPATGEFWAELTSTIRERCPGFWLIAEAYWGREWDLQEMGFDFTYDKILVDRLRDGEARSIRDHLLGRLAYQVRCVRFLEHHYQDRASDTFPPGRLEAAAVLLGAAPGMMMMQDGQCEGRKVRAQLQLSRRPPEGSDVQLAEFYGRLLHGLSHPARREGNWRLLPAEAAGQGDAGAVFVQRWHLDGGGTLVAVVNFSADNATIRFGLDILELDRVQVNLVDTLGGPTLTTPGRLLLGTGLQLDLRPWEAHLYRVETRPL